MKKIVQYCFLVSLILALPFMTSNVSARELFRQKIVGKWKFKDPANGPQNLSFLKNGTYELDFDGDGNKDIWGAYRISQDWIIMNDVGGDFVFDCGQQGAYKFNIEEGVMSFTLMADQCPSRTQAMSVEWARVIEHKRIIEPPIMMKI